MRFTPTKKISELEALNSATLDTTFVVGISGSTTYKISINQLTSSLDTAFATDLVTTTLSNTLDTKLATTVFNTNSASFHNRINAVSSSVSTGTSGTSGTNGTSGAQGNQGPQGNQGIEGPQGINGTAGSSGVQGPQGESGTNGVQGSQGVQGSTGEAGTSGTNGTQGPQGNQGATGSGTQGAQGPTGGTGPQGNQGPTGPQGAQGTNGTTFNISQYSGSVGITGSLTVSSIGISDSVFLTNTSSLTLTSGSNLYVQNDGIVEITGSLKVNGTTTFASVGGDEGGEIQFGVPTTNTTLQNRVTVDVWQNRLRIFEGSANANGVYIDLSKPTTGNNNEITYKASGIVDAGTFVQLDNIKATITTTGNRGLSLATVSGTFVCNIAGNFAGPVVGASGTGGTVTITTTPSTSIFGWGFTSIGDMANYIITDTTNNRAYRIIIQIGGSFNNNLVSIERLH